MLRDLDVEVSQDWIVLPIEHRDTTFNRLQSLRRLRDSKLDHIGGLVWIELELVALVLDDRAESHRDEASLAGTDEWEFVVREVDLVSLLEVLSDRDVADFSSRLIAEVEEDIVGCGTALAVVATWLAHVLGDCVWPVWVLVERTGRWCSEVASRASGG